MTGAREYRVHVTRDERGVWLADVAKLEGAHTYGRTLPALDRAVREVIVLADDLPDEDMSRLVLDYHFSTGDEMIDRRASEVRHLRARAEALNEQAASRTLAAARELVAQGVPVRDAAVLLGVSPQRVSQMTGQSRAS